MAEENTSLVRVLQFLGIMFALGTIFTVLYNVVTDAPWDLIAGIFFLSYLLLCGLSFGIAGLIAENPERSRSLLTEWLIGTAAILIWVLWIYTFL